MISHNNKIRLHKLFLLISTFVIFHAIILMMGTSGSIDFSMLRFFSVLSNLLLGIAFIARLLLYDKNNTHYISFSALTAISITCLVYNFILIPLGGASSTLSSYSNFVTHLLAMILALANYLFFEEKSHFSYKHVLVGMLFPVIYWAVFVTGFIDFFPYFFMNPSQIGWGATIVWFGSFLVGFILLSIGLVRLDSSDKARQVFRVVFTVIMGASLVAVAFISLFVGGIMLVFMSSSRPRHIEPHEFYSVLYEGVDIPTEGISFDTGISLYINLRGNDITFRTHERPDILIMYRLSTHSVYYQPVYELLQDDDGIVWLRIGDDIRTLRQAVGKNSSSPGGFITVYVPASSDEVFYILEIAERDSVSRSNNIPLDTISEIVIRSYNR